MHRAAAKKKPAVSALEKKVPRNPKYADVRARIDSGLTMDKVRVVTTREYLRRRTETFARVSPSQLHELFTEYEDDDVVEDGEGGTIISSRAAAPCFDGPRIVTHEVEDRPCYERPYLILDVRSPQEFQQCHILQARSFPHQYLNQDKISADLLRYKNRDGHLIILYDEEERLSTATAAQFIEKGFSNTYVLSGGLDAFSEEFPAYVEGDLPEAILSLRHSKGKSSAAAGAQPKCALSEGLARLSMRDGAGGGLRTGRQQRMLDDARSDITSMVSVSASSSSRGNHTHRSSIPRSSRGPGSSSCSNAGSAAAAASSSSSAAWALKKAFGRRRPSSLSGSSVPEEEDEEQQLEERGSRRGGRANPNNMSTYSGVSVAESVISRAQARKGTFYH